MQFLHQGGGHYNTDLFFNSDLLKELFPFSYDYLNDYNIAILLASTRIVGMSCPGINSIFSDFYFNFLTQDLKDFNISKLDYSFKKHHLLPCFHIYFNSQVIQGKITALIRPLPIKNQTFDFLNKKYPKLNFSNQHALIIGGSNGLGNTCAKILALGGANILLSYFSTPFDEQHPNIKSFQLDICNIDDEKTKVIKAFNPTHLYFFTTPSINPVKETFIDDETLTNFIQHYIFGLNNILKLDLKKLHTIFIPSTIFCQELPFEFKEYILAKQMLENFCYFLKERYSIIIPRFPKTKTNQTLELIQQSLPDPDEVLLTFLPK